MSSAKGLILLVNDLPDQLEVTGFLLEQEGYAVLKALGGHEALELLSQHTPDLIISDVAMPDMDGIELCRAIRADQRLKETPILLLSAFRKDVPSMVEALQSGAVDYIEAPYDPRLLLAKVALFIEKRRAERALSASEMRYRLLFENIPLPMWVYDLETLAFLDVNEAAVRHYGYSREEFLSMTILDIRPREDIPALISHVKYIVGSNQRHHRSGIWRHRRKDGTIIEVEIDSYVLELNGRQTNLVLAKDVTDRRRAEEALRRQALVFNTIYDGVVILDLERRITDWNPAAERIFGYAKQEVLGQKLSLLCIPTLSEQLVTEICHKILAEGRWEGELPFIRKDGFAGAADSIFVLQRDAQGNPSSIVGVTRDITARKQLEDQLRQAQKMEAIGRLAGGVAHDFNNLLTAIIGYADLALRRLPEDEKVRRQIAEIKKSAERAANLTRQLLAFSRKQIIQPKTLNINEVVEDMGKMLQRLITENIELRLELAPDLWLVKADPSQIEQVIVNLVVNARDAMTDGGELLIRTANVEVDEAFQRQHPFFSPGRYVMLEVSDTGHGMDAETQKHIFEPFFTTKEKGRGTGLGLSTVYGIVKQSGGFVTVESSPDEGATFRIYLPRAADGETRYEKKTTSITTPRGTETVLFVEDEESVRKMACSTLEEFGYIVLEAADPSQALRLCREYRGAIDLMVTDVVMPQMSGRELAEQARKLRPRMRVLYASGYMGDETLRRNLLEERVPFLEKPFTPETLARKVRETLDESPPSAA